VTARFQTAGLYGLYPIVPSAAEVRAVLAMGVRTVQHRFKSDDPVAIRDEVTAAVDAGREVEGAQVVINDHWLVALQAGASWLHLGQEDLDEADLDAIHASGAGLGISSHSPGERRRALASGASYVALGPIYETTLKRMRFAPQGLARLSLWKAECPVPIVAIGGIRRDQVAEVLAAGADAVAMVSDVRTDDRTALDPSRVSRWMSAFEQRSHVEKP